MKKSLLDECARLSLVHMPKHPQHNCYRHYSFIIQRNQIVEWGVNRSSEPLIGYPKYGKLHSECSAYFKARGIMEQNKEFEVVNIRLSANGGLKISKPCPCCQNFLSKFGCRGVWFSTEAGFAKIILD